MFFCRPTYPVFCGFFWCKHRHFCLNGHMFPPYYNSDWGTSPSVPHPPDLGNFTSFQKIFNPPTPSILINPVASFLHFLPPLTIFSLYHNPISSFSITGHVVSTPPPPSTIRKFGGDTGNTFFALQLHLLLDLGREKSQEFPPLSCFNLPQTSLCSCVLCTGMYSGMYSFHLLFPIRRPNFCPLPPPTSAILKFSINSPVLVCPL